MQSFTRPGLFFSLFVLLSLNVVGCAHAPTQSEETPEGLLNAACRPAMVGSLGAPGSTIRSVKGSVWMKAQSKDASGQFPASVEAHTPDQLKLEAVNVLGAIQAVITVDGKNYQIEMPSKKGLQKHEQGQNSWSGIPLQWAPDLFVGRIPCPDMTRPLDLALSLTPAGDLQVQTKGGSYSDPETFVYHFRSWVGHPWPESLHWEKQGPLSTKVDFKFDDPEDKTHAPRKWEAKSEQGEVKVRWRDRLIDTDPQFR